MLTKEQLKIFRVLRKDIFGKFTFKQIKELSNQKSNSLTQMALREFQELNLIKTQITGNVAVYSLNLGNNLALAYMNLANEIELHDNKKLPKSILSSIQSRISKYSVFFILIVFGSYAEDKATEKSDFDIAVIVETEKSKKEVIPYLETAKRREIINIDYHIFTRQEFLEMLAMDEENLGKQIYRKNIVYYGLINYYSLIKGKGYGNIS